MSYSLQKNDQDTYDVYEKNTDVLIQLNAKEEDAKTLCRKLNLGSGFNGWTPTFFATRYNVVYEEA
jgi:hypothetical protein